MKILELFSGTESFSKVARERGHETFTVDNNPIFKSDLTKDINDLKVEDIPFKPSIIWASPPCKKFSIMSVYRNWRKIGDVYTPMNRETEEAIKTIIKLLVLIDKLKPKYYIIENPRGMLRKMPFMSDYKRDTVTYCKYGFDYMKPTDLWNNIPNWKPIKMCKNKDPCHIKAPRGSKVGLQGGHFDFTQKIVGGHKGGDIKRGIVPPKLCKEILIACEIDNSFINKQNKIDKKCHTHSE